MEKEKYHYEYAAYTDNLYYGRQLICKDRSLSYVRTQAIWANKGVYVIEKVSVYDN